MFSRFFVSLCIIYIPVKEHEVLRTGVLYTQLFICFAIAAFLSDVSVEEWIFEYSAQG